MGKMSNLFRKMSSEELNSALRDRYMQHCFSRLAIVDVPQEHSSDSGVPSGSFRTRAKSISAFGKRVHMKAVIQSRRAMRLDPYRFELRPSRSRTKSENESDLPPELPCVALPIPSMLSSSLSKSRSMESIDSHGCEDTVALQNQEQVSENFATLTEANSVLNGLHRLNVSK